MSDKRKWGPRPLPRRFTPADRPPPPRLRIIWSRIKNFLAGWSYKLTTRAAMRWEIRKRRKQSAKYDPVWKESWWVRERRYSKLAKRLTKLELKYLESKRELRKLRENGQAEGDRH